MAELRQEIAVQKMLDHPNIVKVFETFEDTVKDRHSNLAHHRHHHSSAEALC